jgi:hypothetical protein
MAVGEIGEEGPQFRDAAGGETAAKQEPEEVGDDQAAIA